MIIASCFGTEYSTGLLVIDLLSPLGTDVTLAYFDGYGRNFQNTTFSDNAAISINNGTSPFYGSYRPVTPLAALAGQDARGTWAMAVSDYGYYNGTLNSWSITIQPAAAPAAQPAGKALGSGVDSPSLGGFQVYSGTFVASTLSGAMPAARHDDGLKPFVGHMPGRRTVDVAFASSHREALAARGRTAVGQVGYLANTLSVLSHDPTASHSPFGE